MEKIQFDSGIKEYRLNGMGVLRFNPGDPNVYARFMEAVERMKDLEKNLMAGKNAEHSALKLLMDADRQMKRELSWVFGDGNDFEKLLGGVNLLAMAGNGQRVITNLFGALQPILLSGAESCAREQAADAVAAAKTRRASL
jgi:hypothetical protein